MKMSRLFIVALLASAAFVSDARANVISGLSGSYDVPWSQPQGSPPSVTNSLLGTLQANTELTITYNAGILPDSLPSYLVFDMVTVNNSVTANSTAYKPLGGTSTYPSFLEDPGFSSLANVSWQSVHGVGIVVRIANISGASENIENTLSGVLLSGSPTQDLNVSYQVSSIPLPPAVGLFAVALAALACFSMSLKKSRA